MVMGGNMAVATNMGAYLPKPKLGSGKRFSALKAKLVGRKGVKDPAALAASIGRKKYGPAKFAAMAAAGRKGAE